MLSFDYFIALLYTVSFAVRIKAGTFVKNNVIYKLLRILLRSLKKILGFLGFVFKNLSLVKKIALICVAVLIFDFFCGGCLPVCRGDCAFGVSCGSECGCNSGAYNIYRRAAAKN